MAKSRIQLGDIVRLEAGEKPLLVAEVRDNNSKDPMMGLYYLSSWPAYKTGNIRWRRASGLVLLHKGLERTPIGYTSITKDGELLFNNPEDAELYEEMRKSKKDREMSELYQTKESTPRFGTKLAVNSAGQIVLELKGCNGEVAAFDPKDIEVVTPYTVKLVSSSGTVAEIEAPPGQFQQDDMIFDFKGDCFWKVAEVDTKCRQPRKSPLSAGAIRIFGERIDAPRNKDRVTMFADRELIESAKDK